MNIARIKKFKDQIERILERIRKESADAGTDVNSPDFQDKILGVRKKILNKFGISESDYDSVEEMLEDQKKKSERQTKEADKIDVNKEIFLAMREITTMEKMGGEIPIDIKKIKEEIERVDNKPVMWPDIKEKPKHVMAPFDSKTITGLGFSQLVHPDADHKGIISKIDDLFEKDIVLGNQIEKAKQDLTNQVARIKINHGDLVGMGPDDHHQEKHILESHLGSDLMEKLIRLTKGDSFVDDLHRHRMEMLPTQFAGGTTIGDVANAFIVNEEVGTGDDTTVNFDLDYEPYNTSRIEMWVGNAKLFLTDDFTVSGQTITFLIAPPTGYKIRGNYQRQ